MRPAGPLSNSRIRYYIEHSHRGSEVHSVLSSRAGFHRGGLKRPPACSLFRRSTRTCPRLSLFLFHGILSIFHDYIPEDIIVNRGDYNEQKDSPCDDDWFGSARSLCVTHYASASRSDTAFACHRDPNLVRYYTDCFSTHSHP